MGYRENPRAWLRLYLVMGPQDCLAGQDWLDVAKRGIDGGVTCLQYRDKTASEAVFARQAEALMALGQAQGIPVLINDRLSVACDLQADGLHIGQDDISPQQARAALGPEPVLGLSVGNLTELARHDPTCVDYLGTGPLFATNSKTDAGAAIGVAGLSAVIAATHSPVVAIGGINAQRLTGLGLPQGLAGLAVVSAITQSPDPHAAAETLIQMGP